ncbi:MAG: hypothetical protein WD875_15810 [Pirellulales bacterium]
MADVDENPYQAPQTVDEATDGATTKELIVLLVVVVLMPPGLFAAIVFLAQFLTSGLAD